MQSLYCIIVISSLRSKRTTLLLFVAGRLSDLFVKGNSCVYSCFLDASKAFDKGHYGRLFRLLLDRGMPRVYVRFIIDGYSRQSVCIQWESTKSRNFHTCNGVKQGGVIYPILFAIYYDELISKLAHSPYGCTLGKHFVGALSYADDLTLLSPSLNGLQHMVNICEDYGEEYHVTFNGKKTVAVVFYANNGGCKEITVNGSAIAWSSKVKHLSNIIDSNLSDLNDCKTKKGNFVASINWFIGNFSHNVPLNCYIRLFQAYCSNYYGSVLLELYGRGFKDFCVTWNKAVRRVFNVPYTTHTILLGQLLNTCHVSMQLVKRLRKFIDGMLVINNVIVRHMVRRAISSAQSPLGRNIAIIRRRYAIRVADVSEHHVYRQVKQLCRVDATDTARGIFDLLRARNNELYLHGFSQNDVEIMLNYCCTC